MSNGEEMTVSSDSLRLVRLTARLDCLLCRGPPILKIILGAAVLAGAAFGALKAAESKGMKLELKREPEVDTVQEHKKKFPF